MNVIPEHSNRTALIGNPEGELSRYPIIGWHFDDFADFCRKTLEG